MVWTHTTWKDEVQKCRKAFRKARSALQPTSHFHSLSSSRLLGRSHQDHEPLAQKLTAEVDRTMSPPTWPKISFSPNGRQFWDSGWTLKPQTDATPVWVLSIDPHPQNLCSKEQTSDVWILNSKIMISTCWKQLLRTQRHEDDSSVKGQIYMRDNDLQLIATHDSHVESDNNPRELRRWEGLGINHKATNGWHRMAIRPDGSVVIQDATSFHLEIVRRVL